MISLYIVRPTMTIFPTFKPFLNHYVPTSCTSTLKSVSSLLPTYCSLGLLKDGIAADEKKLQAICDWPTPKSIHDIRSFHRLATFYRRFIRNFSSIVAPLTDCLKGKSSFGENNKNLALLQSKKNFVMYQSLPCPTLTRLLKLKLML
ncbi:LOW QUALITY PROTEIN: hypothetical protein PanWU01x14_075070 [Parasponia andersonii]|uniref:Uncharacterized protein n=1 Tax=Parasponia andersonii TaxID=3476 RepID=A0A2P5DCP6_PARAD|nr:LOW QUALITY PROTEIN: hypothetical protein PanWU01x14_075070 [Parasponia andersonii]